MNSESKEQINIDLYYRYINKKTKTKYELLNIPEKIQINNYTYNYKDQSKSDKVTFIYR